jgi:glyoxylase-like metal-dependent hydrolase (beta-lactamase superfamily II)
LWLNRLFISGFDYSIGGFMQQVVEGVWTFTGLLVGRVYALKSSDGLTLIDTSIAPAGGKILKQLEAAGYQPQAVKRILITHAHPDHVGSLKELQEKTGAEVIASEFEAEVLAGRLPIPRVDPSALRGPIKLRPPNTTLKPVKVDRRVGEGDTLPEVLGGLQVLFTPGHAPGHLSFWQPERRILFAGDVLMQLFNRPHPHLPLAMMTVDMEQDKQSIKRLAGLPVEVLCLGHGKPITQNGAAEIQRVAREAGIV